MIVATAALATLALARPALAQRGGDPSLLTVERIYDPNEFALRGFGPSRWLDDSTYTTIEPADGGKGSNLVRVDAATGRSTVMVAATRLVPTGASAPIDIEDYAWSPDHSKLLIYTNSARVWRQNTRGDYLGARRLAPPAAAKARRSGREAVDADVRQVLARRIASRVRARAQSVRRVTG